MKKLEQAIAEYKTGVEYSRATLKNFIEGYTNGFIGEELMTKFIKSIFDKPTSFEATMAMTEIMANSGEIISLQDIAGIKVDKHSTGGVGDKVTLIIGPIIACLGANFSKVSGRGLGFTGGTLDKLESIPGYNAFLTNDEFKAQIKQHKIALIGQTANLVPADKKIYALRDRTNLTASMPLIASSIMSKKIATGADAILIDIKCGDASFMKTQLEAEKLARWMITLGQLLNKDVKVEITSMATPLGYAIGNKNEVLEAVSFLKGNKASKDLEEVVYSSTAIMLQQAQIFDNEKEAKSAIKKVIENGKAFEKFKEWITVQGGDMVSVLQRSFWNPKYKLKIYAPTSGFMHVTSAISFGMVAVKLGAGRNNENDRIDNEAGIQINKKSGDKVKKDDLLLTLYSSTPILEKVVIEIRQAFQITKNQKIKKTLLKRL